MPKISVALAKAGLDLHDVTLAGESLGGGLERVRAVVGIDVVGVVLAERQAKDAAAAGGGIEVRLAAGAGRRGHGDEGKEGEPEARGASGHGRVGVWSRDA